MCMIHTIYTYMCMPTHNMYVRLFRQLMLIRVVDRHNTMPFWCINLLNIASNIVGNCESEMSFFVVVIDVMHSCVLLSVDDLSITALTVTVHVSNYILGNTK